MQIHDEEEIPKDCEKEISLNNAWRKIEHEEEEDCQQNHKYDLRPKRTRDYLYCF